MRSVIGRIGDRWSMSGLIHWYQMFPGSEEGPRKAPGRVQEADSYVFLRVGDAQEADSYVFLHVGEPQELPSPQEGFKRSQGGPPGRPRRPALSGLGPCYGG